MTIVRCPRCRDEVTIPPKTPLSALVRCPLCHEKYLLSEAASQLPPALILVVSELEPKPVVSEAADDQPVPGEYQLAGGVETGLFDARAPLRPAVRLSPRPKRKEKNALVELVKIGGGGVVGLAMGLMLLWWVFHRDPLELGPSIASYAPWLVPLEFHGRTKISPGNAEPATSGQVKITSRPLVRGPSGATDTSEPGNEVITESGANKSTPFNPLAAKDATKDTHEITEPRASSPAAPMPDLRDLLPDSLPAATKPPSPRN